MSLIIGDETGYGVSFTSHNPEPHDYVRCASYKDAERLQIYLEGQKELLKIAEQYAFSMQMALPEGCDFEPKTCPEAYLQQEIAKLAYQHFISKEPTEAIAGGE